MQKMELIELKIGREVTQIWVTPEVKAYFNQQFVRGNPTELQKKRYVTMMNLMRAAYEAGGKDSFRTN